MRYSAIKFRSWISLVLTAAMLPCAWGINEPTGLGARVGDQSLAVHWDPSPDPAIYGYRLYSALAPNGPFTQVGGFLRAASYAVVNATNGFIYYFQVSAINTSGQESTHTNTVAAIPQAFANEDEFLEYLQGTAFGYFWCEANPNNGLVRDRNTTTSPASIAAVGFALTAIGIGIDHGWITRAAGRQRTLTTLQTFWSGAQGTNTSGTIGYKGWFYHFLDMNTATRYTPFNSELSSIDTALFLGGVLYAKAYFNGSDPDEVSIRSAADGIYGRVDWNWMARGTDILSMGWQPPDSFLGNNWIGYNEAMLLYVLGLGATNPLPASAWTQWTSGYSWLTFSKLSFVQFPPLFGHQYSHCWIDFRHVADAYMNARNTTYFENSRRATLAQRLYCIANPLNWAGYGSNVWGLTASDDPTGYSARGAPPAQNDNGTLAPTAPGGSVMFAPEVCVPTLRYLYDRYRTNLWTAYGFRDAFNLSSNWWDTATLGIDEGPIVIAIENYRTQRVWKLCMQNPETQRGLQRAGFVSLAFLAPKLAPVTGQDAMQLSWSSTPGRSYQVEYSPDLDRWFLAPNGEQVATGNRESWMDTGAPGTPALPSQSPERFYRVMQFGVP